MVESMEVSKLILGVTKFYNPYKFYTVKFRIEHQCVLWSPLIKAEPSNDAARTLWRIFLMRKTFVSIEPPPKALS